MKHKMRKRPLPLILATAGCRSIRNLDEALPAALLPPGRRLDMAGTGANRFSFNFLQDAHNLEKL